MDEKKEQNKKVDEIAYIRPKIQEIWDEDGSDTGAYLLEM